MQGRGGWGHLASWVTPAPSSCRGLAPASSAARASLRSELFQGHTLSGSPLLQTTQRFGLVPVVSHACRAGRCPLIRAPACGVTQAELEQLAQQAAKDKASRKTSDETKAAAKGKGKAAEDAKAASAKGKAAKAPAIKAL